MLKKEPDVALANLKRWRALADFVQNNYLRERAAQVAEEVKTLEVPFMTPFDFDVVDPDREAIGPRLRMYVDNYEKFLIESVQKRGLADSDKKAARIYGLSRTAFVRRLSKLYPTGRPKFSKAGSQ